MVIVTRGQFLYSAPAVFGGASILSACSQGPDPEGYEAVAARTWRAGSLVGSEGDALSRELVRYATVAPSSHNTRCWKFALADKAITILPDLSRRCPEVDPDDHHVFVSLGCAAENLIQAASAHGLKAEASFDATRDAVRVTLALMSAQVSTLVNAIPARQRTRGDYDGKPLSNEELGLLERVGTSGDVRMLLLTEPAAMEGMQFDIKTAAAHEGYPIEKITCPVLTISPEDDRFGTATRARDIAAHVPDGRAIVFPTGGHALVATMPTPCARSRRSFKPCRSGDESI